MAEIKLAYDPKNKIAKKTLRYILSLGVFEEIPKKSIIEISLEEAKSRTINTYKKVSDTFDKIGRECTQSGLLINLKRPKTLQEKRFKYKYFRRSNSIIGGKWHFTP